MLFFGKVFYSLMIKNQEYNQTDLLIDINDKINYNIYTKKHELINFETNFDKKSDEILLKLDNLIKIIK